MDANRTIKYLDAIRNTFGLKGEALEAIEQAKKDIRALDNVRNTQFMKNAREGAE